MIKNRINISFITLLAFSIILYSCVPEDVNSPSLGDVYLKFYGQGEGNEAIDVINASDEMSTIVLGRKLTSTNSLPYLIRANSSGLEVASHIDSTIYKILVDTSAIGFVPNVIPKKIKKFDGIYFVIGSYAYRRGSVDNEGGFWMKINENNLESTDVHIFRHVPLVDILKTNETDGIDKFMLLGHSSRNSAVLDEKDVIINKHKGFKDIILTKYSETLDSVYLSEAFGRSSSDEIPLAIFEKIDKGLIVIGTTESSKDQFSGTNIYSFETTSTATSDLGSDIFGIDGADVNANDIPFDVISFGGFYSIVGITQVSGARRAFYTRVGQDGLRVNNAALLVHNDYGIENALYSMAVSVGNRFVGVGEVFNYQKMPGESSSEGGKGSEIFTTIFSDYGREEGFDQHYGTTTGNDKGVAIIVKPDGDLLVASTVDFGSGITKIGLMKLNTFGELKD